MSDPIKPEEQSDDDDAWDAVLSDPDNQKTLANMVKDIKESAASGGFGEPTIEPGAPKDPKDKS